MSLSTSTQTSHRGSAAAEPQRRRLYTLGGVAALLQLGTLVVLIGVMTALGTKPTTVEGYFVIQQRSELEAILRGDFITMILVGLYLGLFPALYVALRDLRPVAVTFATLFTFIAVILVFGSEATFSMLHLGDSYAAATTEAQRAQLLAAGEAVIASDMWHSTGAYMAGMLLQGAGVIISVVMLRSERFSNVTAYAGLLGNALDLIQHLFHPFVPAVGEVISPVMGLFYVVWFPMLARDLFRLGRGPSKEEL
jgi:hypothetical protein